jgi:hypothetical protein
MVQFVQIVAAPTCFLPPRRGGGLRRGIERLEQLERFEPQLVSRLSISDALFATRILLENKRKNEFSSFKS